MPWCNINNKSFQKKKQENMRVKEKFFKTLPIQFVRLL